MVTFLIPVSASCLFLAFLSFYPTPPHFALTHSPSFRDILPNRRQDTDQSNPKQGSGDGLVVKVLAVLA